VTPEATIFRSVLLMNGVAPDKLLCPDEIPRPPVSVPNLVDNLWEWARPEHFPSRRFAIFASPSPESAAERQKRRDERRLARPIGADLSERPTKRDRRRLDALRRGQKRR